MQVWSTNQVEGVHRFLARSYRLVTGDNLTEAEPTKDQLRSLHIAIKRVRSCLESNPTCATMLCALGWAGHLSPASPSLLLSLLAAQLSSRAIWVMQ